MIETISSLLGVFAMLFLFLLGLLSQIKDCNQDLLVTRVLSKRLLFGHKLSIWGFYGFLFFYPMHLFINFGVINNEVVLPGETSYIATAISFCSILIGKYLILSVKAHAVKVLY
ncbi:hypothetical protein [Paenisporosarcina indica]|uniref:hypothetical protein n=1 Tax=Paenisporosarcina indica TaxID=650093 RepID=UPI00094F620A|nr:hypothetical protein [Paenisporosarcina indica]